MEQVDDMEYELLLVNDGSSDDTLEKCRNWQKKYKDKVLFFFKEFWQRSGNLCRIM